MGEGSSCFFHKTCAGVRIGKRSSGNDEGILRARSKKERDWWVRVTRSGGKSASR